MILGNDKGLIDICRLTNGHGFSPSKKFLSIKKLSQTAGSFSFHERIIK